MPGAQECGWLGSPQGRVQIPGGLGTGRAGPAFHLVNKPQGAARRGTLEAISWADGGQDTASVLSQSYPTHTLTWHLHPPGKGWELDLSGMLGEGMPSPPST